MVRRVVWFCGRSTTDRDPREDLKTFEICIPPPERVIFTEATEEGRATMDRRDAIMRHENDEEVRTPRMQ